jgi:hypothetical protein
MSQEAAPPMPQPTAEHQSLKEHAGNWTVACKFYMDPGQPPMECEATETIEMVGDFWTLSRYEADMMGMPFIGRATLGYEPHNERWVSTWIDSMSPQLFYMTGSQEGDTLTLTGDNWNCMVDAVTGYRMTDKRISADERIFEMFCTMPDGNEMKMMTHHYTRA